MNNPALDANQVRALHVLEVFPPPLLLCDAVPADHLLARP